MVREKCGRMYPCCAVGRLKRKEIVDSLNAREDVVFDEESVGLICAENTDDRPHPYVLRNLSEDGLSTLLSRMSRDQFASEFFDCQNSVDESKFLNGLIFAVQLAKKLYTLIGEKEEGILSLEKCPSAYNQFRKEYKDKEEYMKQCRDLIEESLPETLEVHWEKELLRCEKGLLLDDLATMELRDYKASF